MEPKLKVFLSSAQFQGEFEIEREGLPLLFNKEPLLSSFVLWEIEDYASPTQIDDQYLNNVRDSDVLILLLGETLRPAIRAEFEQAVSNDVLIFAFIKQKVKPDEEMTSFINTVREIATTTYYQSFRELYSKVEDSLLQYYYHNKSHRFANHVMREAELENKLSPEGEERALRIMVGVLDSQAAEYTKESVVYGLILEVFTLSKGPLTLKAIVQSLAELLRQDVVALQSELTLALERLINEGRLTLQNDEYNLTIEAKQELFKMDSNIDSSEKELFEKFYKQHRSKLVSYNLDDYIAVLKRAISHVIYATALSNVRAEINGDLDFTQYDSEQLNRVISASLLDVLPETTGVSSWQAAVVEFLQSNDHETIEWINRTFRGYWCLASLGLDPECIAYKRQAIKDYCVYLDSHIVLRAMVEAGADFQLCSDIVRLGSQTDIDMRLSSSLFREVDLAFAQANKLYYSSGRNINRAIKFLEKINRRYDILAGYLHEFSINKKLSWEAYINWFYSPTNPDKLKDYLLNELGVKVQPEREFSEEQWERIEELTELLLEKRGKLKITGNEQLDDSDEYKRQYTLRTNEAQQMAIVCELRRTSTNRKGSQYWFITFDSFIYQVSAELAYSGDTFYRFPCYIKPARWLQILVYASPKPIALNTFREILLSPAIQHTASAVEAEVISELLNARVDQKIKDPITLRNMFHDIVTRPAVADAYEEITSASPGPSSIRASENLRAEILEAVTSELERLKAMVSERSAQVIDAERREKKAVRKAQYYRKELRKHQQSKQTKGRKKR